MGDAARMSIGGGKWLRPDAARSLARMRAAGMPAGGIASAGRTYAEQVALWEAYQRGTGNLAARPGTSRHETGGALDVTRGTAAQLWMVKGGDAWKVRPGERLRANEYGWRRTVPSEAWHFQYDPAYDKHKNEPIEPEEVDDMPEPKDLWDWDGIPAPDDSAKRGNKNWKPSSYLHAIHAHAYAARIAAGEARAIARAIAAKLLTAEEVEKAAREGAAEGAASALDDMIDSATVVLGVEGGDRS